MKKTMRFLITIMTVCLVTTVCTTFAFAVGPAGYSGFDELITMLKDILKVLAGFAGIVSVIVFAYAIWGDRPEHKMNAIKVLAGGALLYMLSQGIDKFFK